MNDTILTSPPAIVKNVESVESLAKKANQAHAAVKIASKEALEAAIHAGEALLKLKAMVPHGKFGTQIGSACQFGQRTATTYMKLAANKRIIEWILGDNEDASIRRAIEHIAEVEFLKSKIPGPGQRIVADKGFGGDYKCYAMLGSADSPGYTYRLCLVQSITFTLRPEHLSDLTLSRELRDIEKEGGPPLSKWHWCEHKDVGDFDEECKGSVERPMYCVEPEMIAGLEPNTFTYPRDENGEIIVEVHGLYDHLLGATMTSEEFFGQ